MITEIYSNFLHVIVEYQYEFNKLISGTIKNINDTSSIMLSLSVIGIAFIYGLIHAAGPGHGKALVALYFTSNKNDYKKAFYLGYLISIIHAMSALFITFGIYFLLKTMFRKQFNEMSEISMLISAIMIICVGFYLIWHAYKHRKDKEKEIQTNNKNIYSLAVSVGIVPCPGVMTIVLFCVMLGHFTLGLLSAIAMSIGMGLTISLAGVLAIAFERKNYILFGKRGYLLEIVGATLILALGLFLLLNSLKHFQ